jgi:cell division protein FtsB
MASIRQRNDPVRLFWRRIVMLVLVILVLFGIWAVVGVYMKERESSDLRQQAEAQEKDLQMRETALNERISSLETQRGQEAALRDAYQVGKQGEGVVTIVDQPATSTPQYSSGDQNWWQKVFWRW